MIERRINETFEYEDLIVQCLKINGNKKHCCFDMDNKCIEKTGPCRCYNRMDKKEVRFLCINKHINHNCRKSGS